MECDYKYDIGFIICFRSSDYKNTDTSVKENILKYCDPHHKEHESYTPRQSFLVLLYLLVLKLDLTVTGLPG